MNKFLANVLEWIDVDIYLPKDGDLVEVKGELLEGYLTYVNNQFVLKDGSDATSAVTHWRHGAKGWYENTINEKERKFPRKSKSE